jgi:hypothetical protein
MLKDGFLRFCNDPEIACCKAEAELGRLRQENAALKSERDEQYKTAQTAIRAMTEEYNKAVKDNAVLHRALGNAVKYFNCSRCGYAGKCDKRSHENCADVFARRAREETEK